MSGEGVTSSKSREESVLRRKECVLTVSHAATKEQERQEKRNNFCIGQMTVTGDLD